jgi:ABC-type transporter Mla maintaining outer membrane lipid asymmetry ATPase subunit MlaF
MKSITSYTQKEKNNMYSIETKKLSKNFKDKIVVNEINLQIKKIVFKKKMINDNI